ncbi:MAG: primosomal protein N' [Caldilineaceae bacterium]
MKNRTSGLPAPPPVNEATAEIYVEVVVNVPIRRTFGRGQTPPPPADLPGFAGEEDTSDDSAAALQTFHYHLPPELLGAVQPGHLVWVPFGRQTLQGIVVRLTDGAPVATKPIKRLARPQPVLTPAQIALSFWIADYYVAPLSEAVKLFLPPGLLKKDEDDAGIRAKREEVISLRIRRQEIRRSLFGLGRQSKQVQVLETLLAAPEHTLAIAELQIRCDLRTAATLKRLETDGLIALEDDIARLALSVSEAEAALLALRGVEKYRIVLESLADADGPLWKSELYARVDTNLAVLRELHEAGLVQMAEKVRFRDPLAGRIYPRTWPLRLTEQQAGVWQAIRSACFAIEGEPTPARFLLHGVTGSGKTEIYLHAIAETLDRNRQAIVLVPEIALTPQTVARFAGRFPDRVTVIHSGLSAGERYDVWRLVRDGEIDVVVGPRSALFAPLPRLGLIILDEEHESSYKQDAEVWGSFKVFYDARTVARQMAELTGSALILGTATPSLEAYTEAVTGGLHLLELPRRVMGHGEDDKKTRRQDDKTEDGTIRNPQLAIRNSPLYAELPPVEIVDMRQELRANNRSIFSRSMQSELHATLDAREQAILYLNRRGTNTFVLCRDCGHVEECPRCEVPLTYHERVNFLVCHHCNARYPIPTVCPECESKRIKFFGSGTERIEEAVQEISPRARILRWDADTTGRKGSHEEILARFAAHEADVLVGTQMIAKGLDLPLVTFVGVVSADVGLYLPDFRAPERTFQLLTQVAGRAGRSARGGRVIFQTYKPEHYAVQAAAEHDYAAFYQREMSFRREQGYPPAGRLARLVFWHKKLETVQSRCAEMAAALRARMGEVALPGESFDIIGPVPAFFVRHRSFYRWQILVRGPDPARLLRGLDIPFGWRVDVDPTSVL